MTEEKKPIKIVTIGDGAVGKTCLLVVYVNNTFPEDYCPTVFDNYLAEEEYQGEKVDLSLWDTAGQEDFDRIRPLSYEDTDIFLITYAIDDWNSYGNIITKWVPELLQEGDKKSKFILVATKTDLRNDEETLKKMKEDAEEGGGSEPIPIKAGEKLAQDIGAKAFLETSAKNNEGIKEVFLKCVELIKNKSIEDDDGTKVKVGGLSGGKRKRKQKKKNKGGLSGGMFESSSLLDGTQKDDVDNFTGK